MGCYGDPVARTPNVDALAAKGMLFRHAWSNHPVCAPARTAIISGLYSQSSGGIHMRSMVPVATGVKLYPQLLREVHGTDDPGDTGLVLWASRLSAMVALPLLGLLPLAIGILVCAFSICWAAAGPEGLLSSPSLTVVFVNVVPVPAAAVSLDSTLIVCAFSARP